MTRTFRWMGRIALALGLALAAGWMPMRVFGGGGMHRVRRLEADLQALRARKQRAARDIERLRWEAQALREDLGAIEAAARDRLGWVRPDERIYQIE